jgi:SagB-type dehydrogenase family enzyme
VIHRYHDATKHHFHRFARSLGYLDWSSQPNPFRSFPGSPVRDAASMDIVGDVLRHSLGLSAWKRYHQSRWALRVNPSSGNLHPTEAFVVAPVDGAAAVFHYAPDRHALEQRCVLADDVWRRAAGGRSDVWLIALTSIHWREAWKYGERAFRYCQHDLGHAIAAISIAADLAGRRTLMLPQWSHAEISALAGLDRDDDYVEAEREEPGCLLAVSAGEMPPSLITERGALVAAARQSAWSGRASQLSEDHVEWTIIDEVARATSDPGRPSHPAFPAHPAIPAHPARFADTARYSRDLVLQRRSALAFDGASFVDRPAFLDMLRHAMPAPRPPWHALWWPPCIHLALFVHRVTGLEPGLYLLARDPAALDALRAALNREFLWERMDDALPLFCLARGACTRLAQRLSCDQEIAADGFFSLGMIADFDAGLARYGPAFYRHLFWESGVVGQVLYLEAEAGGARATGIGCFYDDPVHDVLGIADHAFQSLYHFTVGVPVEDTRLTTEPPYSFPL